MLSVMELSASVTVARDGRYVSVVRGVLGSLLDGAQAPVEVVDDLSLAVGEACANVVRHASGSHAYRVELEVAQEHCVVEVVDEGPGFRPPAERTLGLESETGRGIALMRALTDELEFSQADSRMRVRMSRVW